MKKIKPNLEIQAMFQGQSHPRFEIVDGVQGKLLIAINQVANAARIYHLKLPNIRPLQGI